MVHGPVPCLELILPCRNFRLLQSCYCRMAFHLSGKVVALHLDNSTAKAYLCNQGGTVSPFLSRLACRITESDLTSMVLPFFQHTFLPTSMWRQIFCLGISCFWSGTFYLRWLRQLFAFGAFLEVDLVASSRSTQCQHYFTLETPLPLGALGLNAFSHPWNFQVSYGVSSSGSGPSCSGQVSSRTCQSVNSDIYFWWLHVGWKLLGFPQFSACWQTFLGGVPS